MERRMQIARRDMISLAGTRGEGHGFHFPPCLSWPTKKGRGRKEIPLELSVRRHVWMMVRYWEVLTCSVPESDPSRDWFANYRSVACPDKRVAF